MLQRTDNIIAVCLGRTGERERDLFALHWSTLTGVRKTSEGDSFHRTRAGKIRIHAYCSFTDSAQGTAAAAASALLQALTHTLLVLTIANLCSR